MVVPASKIRIPELARVMVERPRLLDQLRRSLAQVVVFQAPAGFGKSTLAIQWLAGETPAWLDVDPADADPGRFCMHLGAALAAARPSVGETELLTETNPERWLHALTLLTEEHPDFRCTVVLDNYEAVVDSEPVTDLLARWIRRPVGGIRLVLTTRVHPKLKLQRLVERGDALVLDQDALAFNLDEFVAAARLRMGDAVPLVDLERAWSRSSGWCVHVGFGVEGGSSDPARGYIDEEILDQLPDSLAGFLRETSVLDVVSPGGTSVLGLGDAYEENLAAMVQHGVPHTHVDDGFRVHAAVRAMLQRDVREAWSEDRRSRLAETVSKWFRSMGRQDAALDACFDLGVPRLALTLINEMHYELVEMNLHSQYPRWLDRVPPELREEIGYRRIHIRYLSYLGNNRRLLEEFDDAVRAGCDNPASEDYRGMWILAIWGRAHLGHTPQHDRILREWKAIEPHMPEDDTRSRSMVYLALFLAALYQLRLGLARKYLISSEKYLPEGELTSRVNLDNNFAMLDEIEGRAEASLVIYEENQERCREAGEKLYHAINLVNAARSLSSLGRYPQALEAVRDCLDTSRDAGPIHAALLAHAEWVRGETLLYMGNRSDGLAALERSHEHFADYSRPDQLVVGSMLDLWRGPNREPRLTEADVPPPGTPNQARMAYALRRGADALADGHSDEALDLAREVDVAAGELPPWRIHAAFLEARALASNDSDPAPAVDRGLELLATCDWHQLPLFYTDLVGWVLTQVARRGDLPPALVRMATQGPVVDWTPAFRETLHRETDPECAARIRAAARQIGLRGKAVEPKSTTRHDLADSSHPDDPSTLPPLTAELFGTAKIRVQGREPGFQRKAARQILLWLMVEYPAPVHEEEFMDALWPEADTDRGKASMQTAINEIRRALDPYYVRGEPSYVVYRDEHYALELPEGSRIDVHEFKNRIRGLLPERSRETVGRSALIRALRGCLELHRNDLLVDLPYSNFAAEAREWCRARFLEASLLLSRELQAAGSPGSAEVLERALEHDPLWSEGVAALMDRLVDRGRTLHAIRVFRSHRDQLQAEVGLPPDAELTRRYNRLSGRILGD